MNEKDLKIIAIKQRLGEVVSDYEEKVADLRVLITKQEEELNTLRAQLAESQSQEPPAPAEDVLEGEILE